MKDRIGNKTDQNNIITDIKDLSGTNLIPGTLLDHIAPKSEDLDAVIDRMAKILLFRHPNANKKTQELIDRYWSYTGEILSKRFREHLETKQFFGRLQNFSILVIQPQEPPIYGYGMNPTIWKPAEEITTFIVTGEMYSTGRGKIGEASRICNMDVALHLYSGEAWPANLKSAPVKNRQTQKDISRLIEESRTVSREVILDGLLKIYSAGLPSLGKRS